MFESVTEGEAGGQGRALETETSAMRRSLTSMRWSQWMQ